MANIILKCAVCGTPLVDDICPQCGYVQIYFPSSVPKAISDFQKKRVEVLTDVTKRHSDQLEEANRGTVAAQKEAEKLRADLFRANDTVREQNNNITLLNTQNQQLTIRNNQLERDLTTRIGNSTKEKGALNAKITDLQSVINLQTSEIADLKKSLKSAQDKLLESLATPSKTLKGIVIIEDVKHAIRSALPVYEGLNTYGSNPDKDSHCQIKFNVRGFRFLPLHFSVRTSQKGLILEGASGANIYQNGGLIKSGVYARQADNFMLDDKVRINVTQI